MSGDHRVLVAAQPPAWAVLQAMLGDLAHLFAVHTTADAFKILEGERIDLIVCTIAFDESRMTEFLATVKRSTSTGHIPFLCVRALPGIVRDSLVSTIRDGCKAIGAADLVDIAKLSPEQAKAAIRTAVGGFLQ
jgi:response regulator RpfG family c-di-GMP phosphodiesterase